MSQHFTITLDRNNALRMSCQNANCENERKGWVTVLNVAGDEKHAAAARLIEQDSGKKYLKLDPDAALEWLAVHGADYGMTLTPRLHDLITACPRGFLLYLFPPGQPCFKRHLDREVSFAHRTPRGVVRVHERPLDFNEHHNEVAYAINQERQRG